MTSAGVNVLRYSALVFGVFYGITHQSALKVAAANAKLEHEYEHKNELIKKAKAEFSKKNAPKESTDSAGNVISDPENPNFDLEAYLSSAAAGDSS